MPGSQRSVKFVKYFKKSDVHLITVKEESYSSFSDLNFIRTLPIKNEIIYRTSMGNIFEKLLNWRAKIRSGFKSKNIAFKDNLKEYPRLLVNVDNNEKKSLYQKIKDFIYNLCYFPDIASGWIFPAIVVGRKIIKREKIDVLFATGMPWSALVIAYILHKLTKVPFVVDFRDPWIGNPFHQSKGSILDNFSKWLEKSIVENASIVCANTETLRDEFRQRYPLILPDKFIELPNGFDADDFKDVGKKNKRHSMNEELVLAHAGYLYEKRDPAPIIDAIKMLEANEVEKKRRFRFLQIGNIEFNYDFKKRYSEFISNGVIELTGILPYNDCLEYLLGADVLLLIQPNTKTQVPSKLYDYLCLNRPILTITPLDGELCNIVQKHRFGDVFSPTDVIGISKKLNELKEEKKAKGYLVADYSEKYNYDIRNTANKLEDLLFQVMRNPTKT